MGSLHVYHSTRSYLGRKKQAGGIPKLAQPCLRRKRYFTTKKTPVHRPLPWPIPPNSKLCPPLHLDNQGIYTYFV